MGLPQKIMLLPFLITVMLTAARWGEESFTEAKICQPLMESISLAITAAERFGDCCRIQVVNGYLRACSKQQQKLSHLERMSKARFIPLITMANY